MINIYVGSQHGNAEGIAHEIYGRLKEINENLEISIYPLNKLLEHIDPKKVIIITSTTGNADIPDNASKFWLKIKKRTLDKNYFENMSYLILGLGDTNYSVFCAAAKKKNICHSFIVNFKKYLKKNGIKYNLLNKVI